MLAAEDGTNQTRYLFGLDLIYQDDGSETRYLLADGLGSVRAELVSDTVESVTTYGPYGNLLARTGSRGTFYGFTGEQEDALTGLVFLRARYYNNALRVFMTRDPYLGTPGRPSSQHGYIYGGNNPVNRTDPSGLCEEIADEACWDLYLQTVHRFPETKNRLYFYNGQWVELKRLPWARIRNELRSLGEPNATKPQVVLSDGTIVRDKSMLPSVVVDPYVNIDPEAAWDLHLHETNWVFPYTAIPVTEALFRVKDERQPLPQALQLTLDWYFELGDAERFFGLECEITQHLIYDKGLVEARSAWIRSGRNDMPVRTEREYNYVFGLIEFSRETFKMLGQDDWSGSFLGGYQVGITTIEDYRDSTLVEITVFNRTGWESGTRRPFSGESRLQNEARGTSGYGGNLDQYYTWREIINK